MEYADWINDDAPVPEAKLQYYSRCIRNTFDATGWPKTTIREEALT